MCRSSRTIGSPGSRRIDSSNSNGGRLAVSTFAFATISSNSPAAEESHVMPPPTPYSAIPVSASIVTVLIATLNDADGGPADAGARKPTAPQ